MTEINFILLNASLIITMMVIDISFYYFLLNHSEEKQKLSIYHFSNYFTFSALGFVLHAYAEGHPLLVLFSNVVYVFSFFSLRQGILIRNGLQPIALLKNKWLYFNIFSMVFLLSIFIYLDDIETRVLISSTNMGLIISSIAVQGFRHKNKLTNTDKLLCFLVIFVPIVILTLTIITNFFLVGFEERTLALLTAQIFMVFLWSITLTVVLLFDLLDWHYKNSITDGLTQLYNRAYFNEYVSNKLSTMSNGTHALMFLDIDFFKKVNDTYGHDAGDLVIVTISQLVKEFIKDTGIVARFGGEEFAVFYECIDKKDSVTMAEKLRLAIQESDILYDKQRIKTTISIGVCELNTDSLLIDELKRADKALYQAKETGRNKVCFI